MNYKAILLILLFLLESFYFPPKLKERKTLTFLYVDARNILQPINRLSVKFSGGPTLTTNTNGTIFIGNGDIRDNNTSIQSLKFQEYEDSAKRYKYSLEYLCLKIKTLPNAKKISDSCFLIGGDTWTLAHLFPSNKKNDTLYLKIL